MLDVLSVGEVLIDMTPAETVQGEACFLPRVGGAPVNAACALAVLGRHAAFAGRVGRDAFGRMILDRLDAMGLDTALIQQDEARGTTLAFVHLDSRGERTFSFYRKGLADVSFTAGPDVLAAARNARMVSFGSVALAEEPERSAVLSVVQAAKEAGARIACDPNLRFPLWDDRDALKRTVLDTLGLADIIKLSEEEALFLFGIASPEEAARHVQAVTGAPVVFITCGRQGACAALDGTLCSAPAYAVKTVDTTGAGDCFFGAALDRLLDRGQGLGGWSYEEGERLLRFACAAGSLATKRQGAIDALPTRSEIEACVAGSAIAEG